MAQVHRKGNYAIFTRSNTKLATFKRESLVANGLVSLLQRLEVRFQGRDVLPLGFQFRL